MADADGDPAARSAADAVPGTPDLRVRRVRRRRELLDLLDPHEPRSTPLRVDVEALGAAPWRTRAWAVERSGDVVDVVALVVLTRAAFDRWHARCILIDVAAAGVVAGLVDRSVAWSLSGSGLDVGPVAGHLRRARRLAGMPWVVVEHPVHVTDQPVDDERVRVAGRADRGALHALYRGYELAIGDTTWQERSAMRTLLRSRRVLVAEDEGRIVGALMVGGPTRRYVSVDRLTVLPEHRSRGLAWTLVAAAQRLANEHRVGGTAAIAASNPMEFGDEHLSAHWWLTVTLAAPSRVRGQQRLRSLYARLGGVPRRPAQIHRDVDPSQPRR